MTPTATEMMAMERVVREMEMAQKRKSEDARWTRTFPMWKPWEDEVAAFLNEAAAAGVEVVLERDDMRMEMKVRPKVVAQYKTPDQFKVQQLIATTTGTLATKAPDKPPLTIDIAWLQQAIEKARESAAFIRLEIEPKGVTVIGEAGDRVCSHTITWQSLDKANVNPLFLAIEHVERELDGDGVL